MPSPHPDSSPPPPSRRAAWWAPWLVVGISLTLTFGTYSYLLEESRQDQRDELAHQATLATEEIRERLFGHAQNLRALRAFMAVANTPATAAWQTYIDQLDVERSAPGIIAYGYAMRRAAGGALTPRHFSPVRDAVFFADGDPHLARTIDAARDSGKLTLSEGIELGLEDRDGHNARAILMAMPVFRNGAETSTPEQRQTAFAGVVYAVYRIDDLVRSLPHVGSSGIKLHVLDTSSAADQGAQSGQRLFVSENGANGIRSNVTMRRIALGGRTWELHFSAAPKRLPDTAHLVALGGGLIASLLLGLLSRAQVRLRLRADSVADEMTRELRLSEERFQLASAGTQDGIWDRDLIRGTEWQSARLREILALPPMNEAADTATLMSRVHPDDRAALESALERHLRERQPFVTEYRFRRGDERWAWLISRGQAVWNDAGQPIRMVGAITDISERKAAEEELRHHRDHLQELVDERTSDLLQAKEMAEHANEAKSEFLANISHELRTPLHSILSFAALGHDRAHAGAQDKLAHYFERVQQSGGRLLSLVNDLLELSKLEAGKVTLEFGKWDIQALVREVVTEIEPLAAERKVRIEVVPAEGDTTLFVDSKRIAQVIRNILSNAVKYSPDSGIVHLRFYRAQLARGRRASDTAEIDALAIEVRDSGIGIPEGELNAIFDKFVQSSRTNTGAGGTGLGLSISREIVLAHKGSIRASNNPGGGASFTVLLPREVSSSAQGPST